MATIKDLITNVGAVNKLQNQLNAALYAYAVPEQVRTKIEAHLAELGIAPPAGFWRTLTRECDTWQYVAIVPTEGKAIIFACKEETDTKKLHDYVQKGALIVHKNSVHYVRQRNWMHIEKMLQNGYTDSPEPPTHSERRQIGMQMHKQNSFYAAAAVDNYRKLNKKGYNMSFDELRAVAQLHKRNRALARVESVANGIYQYANM